MIFLQSQSLVPVYKVECYIHICIESVLRQTFSDWEMILVDDGSPDTCPAICDRYAQADSRIRVVHKQNAGLGYARNSGLDAASGKYVCFSIPTTILHPIHLNIAIG